MDKIAPYDQIGVTPVPAWQNANPQAGTKGSIVNAEAFNAIMAEIVNAQTLAGVTPNSADYTQLGVAAILGSQSGSWTYAVDTGTADALVATLSPAPKVIGAGFGIWIKKSAVDSATTSPTIKINTATGTLTFPIVKATGDALVAGDLGANALIGLRCDGVSFRHVGFTKSGIAALVQTLRPVLQSNSTYYVNAATGADTNTGLTAGSAFATLQAAVNAISKFNLNGYSVTVNVASGTYAPVALQPVSGSGSVVFVGNAATPSSCLISGLGTGQNCITALSCGGAYLFNGFKLQTSGSSPTNSVAGVVAAGSGTTVTLTNIEFGGCDGGHMIAGQNAIIYIGGANTVSGTCSGSANGAGAHMCANALGNIFSIPGNLPTMTIVGTPFFAAPWVYAYSLGSINVRYGSAVSNPNPNCARFLATGNSVINTGGGGASYYPGNAPGSTQSGGQYL